MRKDHYKDTHKHKFLCLALVMAVFGLTFSGTAIVPTMASHTRLEVGVWVYAKFFPNLPNSIVDNLIKKNINTIYFSEGGDGKGWNDPDNASKYKRFINYARNNGIRVYAVTLEDPYYVLASANELRNVFGGFIAKTKNTFNTYIIDVEPHAINLVYGNDYPRWETNQEYYLKNYVRMSKILRDIADEHGVNFRDTVPPSFHQRMKNVGITGGLNQLSSHSINLMAYQGSIESIMSATRSIRQEPDLRLVIHIKVTEDPPDPYLEGSEISEAIKTLKEQHLRIGIWYANSHFIRLSPTLFR